MNDIKIGVKPSPVTCSNAKSDKHLVSNFIHQGYDKILLPITNSKYRENCQKIFHNFIKDQGSSKSHQRKNSYSYTQSSSTFVKNLNDLVVPPPNLSEVNLIVGDHLGNTIGLIASWIELESSDIIIAEFSNQILYNELSYAQYIGLKNVILAPPKDTNKLSNFANFLLNNLRNFPTLKISISLPFCEEPNLINPKQFLDYLSTWDMWNTIRINCDYHENLSVSLALPKTNIPSYVIDRWFTEPIYCLLISSSIFLKNVKNYPVISKNNQFLIYKLLLQNEKPFLLLHNIEKGLVDSVVGGTEAYLNYLKYLIKLKPELNDEKKSSVKSGQKIEIELVDLFEKLKSNQTLSTESLGKKHELQKCLKFEEAVLKALTHLKNIDTGNNNIISIALLNTNGYLINKILNLSASKSIRVKVHIIEQNLNTSIYLSKQNKENWSNKINIINNIDTITNHKLSFDLIINESAQLNLPEVIKNVEPFLRPNGIIIPEKLSMFIAPSLSPSLYKQTLNSSIVSGGRLSLYHKPYFIDYSNFNNDQKNVEKIDILSNKINEIWDFKFPSLISQPHNNPNTRVPLQNIKINEFVNYQESNKFTIHPDNDSIIPNFSHTKNKHNNRITTSTFKIHHKGVIHGILSFLKIHLYDDIYITNNPKDTNFLFIENFKPCWFPMEMPIYISDDTEVEISIRRISDNLKFWFEWSLESFIYVLNDNNANASSLELDKGPSSDGKNEDCENQVRVRTCISKIHNSGGIHSYVEI